MKFEFIEIIGKTKYDPLTITNDVFFTQADFYTDWQENLGRKTRRFVVLSNGKTVAYFQMIKYPLIFGKSYYYIPYGPVVKDVSDAFLKSLKNKLIEIAKQDNIVFIRLDFTPIIKNEILVKYFKKSSLCTYHSASFQPRLEWMLSLEKSNEQLLSEMHEKTRYSIRLSERKGITTEIITSNFNEYFDIFYDLMSTTANRNNFNLHPKEYYLKIFDNFW